MQVSFILLSIHPLGFNQMKWSYYHIKLQPSSPELHLFYACGHVYGVKQCLFPRIMNYFVNYLFVMHMVCLICDISFL